MSKDEVPGGDELAAGKTAMVNSQNDHLQRQVDRNRDLKIICKDAAAVLAELDISDLDMSELDMSELDMSLEEELQLIVSDDDK
jgi:hypothetical protein